jgi:hypothetical protein
MRNEDDVRDRLFKLLYSDRIGYKWLIDRIENRPGISDGMADLIYDVKDHTRNAIRGFIELKFMQRMTGPSGLTSGQYKFLATRARAYGHAYVVIGFGDEDALYGYRWPVFEELLAAQDRDWYRGRGMFLRDYAKAASFLRGNLK